MMVQDPCTDQKTRTLFPEERRKRENGMSGLGGTYCPHFCPPIPNGEFAKSLKQIADYDGEAGVHFRIVETGGLSMKSILQKSIPLQKIGCGNPDCLPCLHNDFQKQKLQ